MEIWQKGKGIKNLQIDGINCKHMTQSVLPWPEATRDIPECSWREERDVQNTMAYQSTPKNCRDQMNYRIAKMRIFSGRQTNPRSLGTFDPYIGTGLCFLLKFRRAVIADVEHSGFGGFWVKDYLPSAGLQHCQAGPVPPEGLSRKRTPSLSLTW